MRLVWFILLVACEKAPREGPRHEPSPVVVNESPRLRYAAKTENPAAGPNQTYFHIVEDESLFSVADASGSPSTSDPAKLAAEGVSPFPREACRVSSGPDVGAQLACVVREVNDQLAKGKLGTASLAAVVVEGRKAYVAVSGDARVVWVHARTRDVEVRTAREPDKPLGTSFTSALAVFMLELRDGDTLAIVNRGLFETAGMQGIARGLAGELATPKQLEAAVEGMIGEAQRVPDHPALTAIVVYVVPS